MAWRKYENHKEETKDVKKFLLEKGFKDARVGHGTGTAWGWLEVRTNIKKPNNCTCNGERGRCDECQETWSNAYNKLSGELMGLTGRHGDYGGCITIEINLT